MEITTPVHADHQLDQLAGQFGPPAAITGFFTVRMVPWIMLRAVFSIFIN